MQAVPSLEDVLQAHAKGPITPIHASLKQKKNVRKLYDTLFGISLEDAMFSDADGSDDEAPLGTDSTTDDDDNDVIFYSTKNARQASGFIITEADVKKDGAVALSSGESDDDDDGESVDDFIDNGTETSTDTDSDGNDGDKVTGDTARESTNEASDEDEENEASDEENEEDEEEENALPPSKRQKIARAQRVFPDRTRSQKPLRRLVAQIAATIATVDVLRARAATRLASVLRAVRLDVTLADTDPVAVRFVSLAKSHIARHTITWPATGESFPVFDVVCVNALAHRMATDTNVPSPFLSLVASGQYVSALFLLLSGSTTFLVTRMHRPRFRLPITIAIRRYMYDDVSTEMREDLVSCINVLFHAHVLSRRPEAAYASIFRHKRMIDDDTRRENANIARVILSHDTRYAVFIRDDDISGAIQYLQDNQSVIRNSHGMYACEVLCYLRLEDERTPNALAALDITHKTSVRDSIQRMLRSSLLYGMLASVRLYTETYGHNVLDLLPPPPPSSSSSPSSSGI